MHRIGLAAFVTTALLSFTAPARACSYSDCFGGSFLPAHGVVPPNLPAIVWTPLAAGDSGIPSETAVRFVRTDGATTEEVGFTLETRGRQTLIILDEALAPGAKYEIDAATFCPPSNSGGSNRTTTSFETAADEAPFPTSLGTLRALRARVEPLTVSTYSGSCSSEITATQTDVHLRLSDEAQPWSHLFEYSTWVDGVLWEPRSSYAGQNTHGTSWQGRAMDLLYANCQSADPGADPGLSEGTHLVEFQAALPGTATVLSSDTIEINLSCDTANSAGGCNIRPIRATPGLLLSLSMLLGLVAYGRWRTVSRSKVSRVSG